MSDIDAYAEWCGGLTSEIVTEDYTDNLASELVHVDVLMGHLLAERDELGDELAAVRAAAAETAAERDNLASDLADLREAHMHTVTALAQARGQRDTFRARIERSGW